MKKHTITISNRKDGADKTTADPICLTPDERRALVYRIEHTLVYVPLYRDDCEVLKGILAKLKGPTEGEK